jgi:hypothetical protein
MRSKIIWFMLTLSAVVALALFQPAVTYAGQVVASHFAVASADSAPASVTLAAHGHGGGGMGRGGGWSGQAFHGGGGWHRGGHFYGGGFYQPYYGYSYPYYVEPYCDTTVWDSDLGEWVCASYED